MRWLLATLLLGGCLLLSEAGSDRSCEAYKRETEGIEREFEPDCTEDGMFKSRQCDYHQKCWCSTPQGEEVTVRTPKSQLSLDDCNRLTGQVPNGDRSTTRKTSDRDCDDGYWGPYCDRPCKCGEHTFECDRYEGCVCEEGYTGDNCERAVNFCDRLNACQFPHEKCVLTPGSYKCVCEEGFYRNEKGLCGEERTTRLVPRMSTKGPDTQECPDGYWGLSCDRICSCGEHSLKCDRSEGCICREGWRGDRCRDDVDECMVFEPCRQPHKSCVNTIGSFECVCIDGFRMTDSGKCELSVSPTPTKRDRYDCNRDCEYGCEHRGSEDYCICPPGHRLVEETRCVRNPSTFPTRESTRNPFSCEHLECEHGCKYEGPHPYCVCEPGYRLVGVNRCVQRIESTRNPLDKTSRSPLKNCDQLACDQRCEYEGPFAFCLCNPGFRLVDDNRCVSKRGECERECQHFCDNDYGRPVCKCHKGYILEDGYKCIWKGIPTAVPTGTERTRFPTRRCDRNCQHYCENDHGKHVCKCYEGYYLVDGYMCFRKSFPPATELPTDDCDRLRCQHSCGYEGPHAFCLCSPGFRLVDGNRCVQKTIFVDPAPVYTEKKILMIILGCLLAATAVTTLVLFCVCISSRNSRAKLKAKGKQYAANLGEATFNINKKSKSSDKAKLILA